jgi:hypothetical protein
MERFLRMYITVPQPGGAKSIRRNIGICAARVKRFEQGVSQTSFDFLYPAQYLTTFIEKASSTGELERPFCIHDFHSL